MLNLFQRAHKNLPLTPEERAILKFVYNMALTAALTAAAVAIQYIASNGQFSHINWPFVGSIFLASFIHTFMESIRKWFSSQKDGPLGAATQLLSSAIQKAAEQTLPTVSNS